MNPLVNAVIAAERRRDLRRAVACCAEVLAHRRALPRRRSGRGPGAAVAGLLRVSG